MDKLIKVTINLSKLKELGIISFSDEAVVEDELEAILPLSRKTPQTNSKVLHKISNLEDFFKVIEREVYEAWLTTYNDEAFIQHEINCAITWLLGHQEKSRKTKLGWNRFFSAWLSRSFDRKGAKVQHGSIHGSR